MSEHRFFLRWFLIFCEEIEFADARVEDPANTNNVVSDDLMPAEKRKIAAQAQRSYSEKYWQNTIW